MLEGNERRRLRLAAVSLERTKHAIRAAVHCEVVITRANDCAICPRIKVSANEGLFIIAEHKSSHNPIACPLIPEQRSERKAREKRSLIWAGGGQRLKTKTRHTGDPVGRPTSPLSTESQFCLEAAGQVTLLYLTLQSQWVCV